MKILIVLTSHDKMGETGHKTGFWLEEFASPYYIFKEHNFNITLASPKGGQPPQDPKSIEPDSRTAATDRFYQDEEAKRALSVTMPISALNATDYDAVFYPGGHGPLWDLSEDKHSIGLIETIYRAAKPLGLVCHGPGVLRHTVNINGAPLVKGKRVTGFSNSEEIAVQLDEFVPFSVEDMLSFSGGIYTKGDDWQCHIEIDGNLVTGQNPASSSAVANAMVELLTK